MRQSRRNRTPAVYTPPKITAISEATRIALLRDRLEQLNEAQVHHHHYPPGTPSSAPAPAPGVIQGVDGRPLSTPAPAAPAPAAPAGVNPGIWQRIWSRVGAQLGEGLLTRVTPWIIENLFAAGLAAFAAALAAGHWHFATERWQRGDKLGALLTFVGGIGSVMSQIPWFPAKAVGYFTWMVTVLWDLWRETPEGTKAIAEVDQKIKEQPPAGPSGAKPAEPKAEPPKAEPPKAEPPKAEPPKAEPPKAAEKGPEPKVRPEMPNPAGSVGKVDWSKLRTNP